MEKLIDVILAFIHMFVFWVVIDSYEMAVLMRLGKYKKTLGPGLHFILPLGIDDVLKDNVVVSAESLIPQTLETKDGVNIVVTPNVSWSIHDIRAITLNVEGAESVMETHVSSVLGAMIHATDYAKIRTPGFWKRLTTKAANEAESSGVTIHSINYKDLAAIDTYRLMGVEMSVSTSEE